MKHLHFHVKVYNKRFCTLCLFSLVTDTSWLSSLFAFSLCPRSRPMGHLQGSAEIRCKFWPIAESSTSVIVTIIFTFHFHLWMFMSRGGLYAEEETDKNKMLWSMHDLSWLFRFIYSRTHMTVAHVLAVCGLKSLFPSIRSPSTVLSECYGRACWWQTPVQSHCPRPGH